jgi:hypothetical protein
MESRVNYTQMQLSIDVFYDCEDKRREKKMQLLKFMEHRLGLKSIDIDDVKKVCKKGQEYIEEEEEKQKEEEEEEEKERREKTIL